MGNFGLGIPHLARAAIEIQASTNPNGATIKPSTGVMLALYPKSGAVKINANDTKTAPIATFASCEARVGLAIAESWGKPGA